MPTEQDKIINEYKKLCNRILSNKCMSLEQAQTMIRVFNFYTSKGKHFWDWNKVPIKEQHKKIYESFYE